MKQYISVAGHNFVIVCAWSRLFEMMEYNYLPFIINASACNLFELEIVLSDENVGEESQPSVLLSDESPYIWTFNSSSPYDYGFSLYGERSWGLLQVNEKESRARLVFRPRVPENELSAGVNNAIMLLYALFSSLHETLLLHSSVVMYYGRGFAFLGESGTGKSTHSDLWVKHFPGTTILNDDNPVLRLVGDEVMIYGSPWSGKRNFYRNEGLPLGGLVMLEQASANHIQRTDGIQAFASLLISCSCIGWNRQMAVHVEDTIAEVLHRSHVYRLKCRADKEAALLCHAELTK